MIIYKGEPIKTFNGVLSGLSYQMREDASEEEKSKVFLLDGSPDLLKTSVALTNSRTQKAFPVLISWKESPQEFRQKLKEIAKKKGRDIETEEDFRRELKELWEEIKELLFAGYNDDELTYTAVVHEDTDNFHIHVYVANNFAQTGKTIKFWHNPEDLRLIERYFNLKYGFDEGEKRELSLSHKEELLRRLGKSREYGKIALKEELHSIISEQILKGKIKDAESLEKFLEEELGAKITRHGKNYIGLEIEGIRLRLKGAIYGKEWKLGKREEVIALQEVEKRLKQYKEKKAKEIEERFKEERMKLKAKEGIKELKPKVSPRKAFKILSNVGTSYEELKRIPLPKLFSYLDRPFYFGISPQGEYILAKVPWREDRHPSFFATKQGEKWLWIDLARNEGGSVIDFVMKFFSTDFKNAVEWLKEHYEEILKQEDTYKKDTQDRNVEIKNLRPALEDEEWIDFIKQAWKLQRIPKWLYLGDIYKLRLKWKQGKDEDERIPFLDSSKQIYPAFVLPYLDRKQNKNETIRNAKNLYWRIVVPSRTDKGKIGSVPPTLVGKGGKRLYIVEGLTDALAIYQIDPEADILILHSALNVNKIPKDLEYEEILVATDNDEEGEKAFRKIKAIYPQAKRFHYKGKDPMDAWLNGQLEMGKEIEKQKNIESQSKRRRHFPEF